MSDNARRRGGEAPDHESDIADFAPDENVEGEPLERVLLSVLGHCVAFAGNVARIVDIARERFAAWDEGQPEELASRLHVLIAVSHYTRATGRQHTPATLARPGGIPLVLQAPDAVAVVFPADRSATAIIHPTLLAQPQLFAEEVLDALLLALVARFDRHPLHAATLARGEHAALLYGASGAGKSTLAWMAHSAGLPVLGDDRAWIQLQPKFRLWTERARVRLHPQAMQHFPDTDRARLAVDAARGDKFVTMLDGGADASSPITRVTTCLLARSTSHATLERVGRDEMIDVLSRDIAPGFDRFPVRHAEVVARVAADGGWRLALSNDPWEALPHLRTMLDG